MKRIGMFTGEIYNDDVDTKTIHECCKMTDDVSQDNICVQVIPIV